MKKIFGALIFALMAFPAFAGTNTLGVGVGTEKVNDKINVDLYQIQGYHRFDNGITLGASVQAGYPDTSVFPSEKRYEGILGYTTRINKYSPYIFSSIGIRTRQGLDDITFYTIKVGSKVSINSKLYLDFAYRLRDTNDMDWKTDTYFTGIGYNITPTETVQFIYGKTEGSFDGDQYGIALIKRF